MISACAPSANHEIRAHESRALPAPGVRAVKKAFTSLAQRRALSLALIALLSFGVSAALSACGCFPTVHDEFSYLLGADTFAHGRLSNPTHPLWVHFESMHIIHQPTYASKYPPGQGLALAVGQVLTGQPLVGVWLSAALACAAICWMLMAWLPPRWALLGGLLAALHPTLLGGGQEFFGAPVAVLGGALVLGGMRRVMERARPGDAVLLGLGMAILANSRPYEGLVLSLAAIAALVWWFVRRNRLGLAFALRRVGLPLALVLGANAGWMAWYNFRVTGNAFRLPYLVHEETYGIAPVFLFQSARPVPIYRHEALREFHQEWELPTYVNQRSLQGLLSEARRKLYVLGSAFLLTPLFLLSVITLPWVVRSNGWMRFALVTCGLVTAALLVETYSAARYAAPITALVFVLLVQGLRYLRLWTVQGKPLGRWLVRVGLLLCLTIVPAGFAGERLLENGGWGRTRQAVLNQLVALEGKHLVIVRYQADHDIHHDWVYNEADIDNARVVWAREMGPSQDAELLDYFKDRSLWLLEADAKPPELLPYRPRN
jgi:hypothetical protein